MLAGRGFAVQGRQAASGHVGGAMECRNNSVKIDAFFTFFGSI